jgi:hypothetical protein
MPGVSTDWTPATPPTHEWRSPRPSRLGRYWRTRSWPTSCATQNKSPPSGSSVTIAWRLETDTAQATLHGLDVNTPGSTPDETPYPVTDTDTEPAAVYLSRLAATTITVTSAIHAGRDLLAAHLRDTLPNPKAVADAILAQRADTPRQAARQVTRQETQATTQQVRTSAVRPGYISARLPGPLPATGPEPQPGPTTDPSPGLQPGVRP